MSEENKVVIEETPEAQNEEIEISTEGLEKEEIEAGEKHGIIKKPVEKEEPKEEKTEDKKEEKPDDKPADPADFDEMDEAYQKDEAKFHKNFTANAKALYFKHKRNKQLRQEAQEQAEEANRKAELLSVKEKIFNRQRAEINDILDRIDKGDETLTTADIRKALAFQKEEAKKEAEEEPDKKDEKPEASKKQQEYLQEKTKNSLLLGRSKYDNFDDIVDLANEVVAQDREVAILITNAFINPEVDEEQLVEKIVKYAKLHPKFGEKPEEKPKGEKKDKQDIDRMVANAQKKKTSASLSAGSGRREISYDDLTVQDVQKMSNKQWRALPQKVREKLIHAAG